MKFEDAFEKLKSIGQQHLLKEWDQLTVPQRTHLVDQITHLDIATFRRQQSLIASSEEPPLPITPFSSYKKSGSSHDFREGKKRIAKGKVGCLLVAGGQGTRLKFVGPKGMFPITPIKHKSLFQVFAEKVAAASKEAQHALPLAIMTSPLNETQTHDFFFENRFFGLLPEQVTFFNQGMLPLLDTQGNLFLETPFQIAEGPDGNGSALKHFVGSGIWKRWQEAGVEDILFVQVDNPLADPFDAELVGFHQRKTADITVKCTLREREDEKVGVLVLQEGHIRVKEYSELPAEEQKARSEEGQLIHRCANLSLFCFSMEFVREFVMNHHAHLPLHPAFKAAAYLGADGESHQSEKPMAWKSEYFIFDALPFSHRVFALLYPRERCFAPLKNLTGADSPEKVQQALQELDRMTYASISGMDPPLRSFELAQEFYYPTPELLKSWKGKPLPSASYIEA